ncbi:hypothetical protein ILUMI_12719 [Ignelater luminosus]|uniref:Uncharacterized protein n=1 Tax=Ignelater luminosus TaxID=2038154 RepID=A0A8K0GBI8_IGNLU|nr:hypothetical protein ILUMI_12719 [Ignelater luminosus]
MDFGGIVFVPLFVLVFVVSFSFKFYKKLKMTIFAFISSIVFAVLIGGVMMDRKVVQEKMEVVWYNDEYYQDPKMVIFNYNDTTDVKVLNASFTLKKDLPNVVMMHVQVYKKSSNNQYHVFPLNMTADICPYLAKETPDTQKFSEHSNMRKCPFRKGFYHVSNMVLEQRKPPPYLPSGSFMAESTTYIDKSNNLLVTRSYANIK